MKETYRDHIIIIEQDPEPQNPRTDYSGCYGLMVCFHKRYNLGDKHSYSMDQFKGWEELKVQLIDDHAPIAILPVYLYDHSGLAVSTTPFACPWDSGQVGYILMNREQAVEMWGRSVTDKDLADKAGQFLVNELAAYHRYLAGEVYGYRILDENGEHVDSCWGYDATPEEILQIARQIVDNIVKDTSAARTVARTVAVLPEPDCFEGFMELSETDKRAVFGHYQELRAKQKGYASAQNVH